MELKRWKNDAEGSPTNHKVVNKLLAHPSYPGMGYLFDINRVSKMIRKEFLDILKWIKNYYIEILLVLCVGGQIYSINKAVTAPPPACDTYKIPKRCVPYFRDAK